MQEYIAIFSDSTNNKFTIIYTCRDLESATKIATNHGKNTPGITFVDVVNKNNILDLVL